MYTNCKTLREAVKFATTKVKATEDVHMVSYFDGAFHVSNLFQASDRETQSNMVTVWPEVGILNEEQV